eukprot:gene1116-1184_t
MASFARKQLISAAVNEGTNAAPSWLNEEENKSAPAPKSTYQPPAPRNPPPPPPAPKASSTPNPVFDPEAGKPSPAPSSSSNAASDFVIEKEVLDQMRQYHLALRLAYVASTVFMAVAAVLCLEDSPDAGQVFMSGYVFFFAVLICCFEFALNSIARLIAVNFGFLYSLTGRVPFLLFVGFMCFSLGTWGIIAMCVLYLVGMFHFYIMYKFPRFEEYLRKKHYFEGRNANNK